MEESLVFMIGREGTVKVMGAEFGVRVTVHHDKFLIIEPTRCTYYSNLFFGTKPYMFQTVPLSIIRSFFTVHTAMVYVTQV